MRVLGRTPNWKYRTMRHSCGAARVAQPSLAHRLLCLEPIIKIHPKHTLDLIDNPSANAANKPSMPDAPHPEMGIQSLKGNHTLGNNVACNSMNPIMFSVKPQFTDILLENLQKFIVLHATCCSPLYRTMKRYTWGGGGRPGDN